MLTFEHYPRRIFHPTRPSAEPNEWELGGSIPGPRDAKSGMFALVRKEILLPSMERRKFIKGIAAAGGITWVSPWISLLGLDQALTAQPIFAVPIRALANKGG